jgi:hypothetical protein
MMGVTSGFNTDDINFFLERQRKGISATAYLRSRPLLQKMSDESEARAGFLIQWAASPVTLVKIKSALDYKDQPHRNSALKM